MMNAKDINMKETTSRKFEFPNGGHSVRKLCDSLYSLGNVQIDIVMQKQYDQYDTMTDDDCELFFVVNHKSGKFNSIKLAEKLKSMGTRFQVVNDKYHDGSANYQLKFHEDFDDIIQYPEFYNVK